MLLNKARAPGYHAAVKAAPVIEEEEPPRLFRARKWPVLLCITLELLWCAYATAWANEGAAAGVEGITYVSVEGLIAGYWITFFVFLVLRGSCLLMWRSKRVPTSVCSALFMFSSSAQFMVYIALYYLLSNKLTYVSTTAKASVSYSEVTGGAPYEAFCDEPYVAGEECDASTMVGSVECCVKLFGKLKRSSEGGFLYPAKKVIPIFELIAVCIASWAWHDIPLIKSTAFDKEFLTGVWLDILDCFMFGSYILRSDVQNPYFDLVGLPEDVQGRPCEGALGTHCTGELRNMLWVVWTLAFSTAIVGPTIYVALIFYENHKKQWTLEQAQSELLHSIRLLSQRRAHALLDETIKLQLEKYVESDHDGTMKVMVRDDEDADDDGNTEDMRTGTAERVGPGWYRVTYNDGYDPEEEELPVGRFLADMESHKNMLGDKCCWGWLRCDFLSPEKETEAFIRRAEWFDAMRSLFFLELPFCAFRFYFIAWLGGSWYSGSSFLFLKNIAWIIVDGMTVLACGNDAALCCSCTPIRFCKKLIKGTKLAKTWFGPSGLFRVVAELANQTMRAELNAEKTRLEAHRAWLILEEEKEKSEAHTRDISDAMAYEAAIEKTEERISKLEKKMPVDWWR